MTNDKRIASAVFRIRLQAIRNPLG